MNRVLLSIPEFFLLDTIDGEDEGFGAHVRIVLCGCDG